MVSQLFNLFLFPAETERKHVNSNTAKPLPPPVGSSSGAVAGSGRGRRGHNLDPMSSYTARGRSGTERKWHGGGLCDARWTGMEELEN